MKLNISPLLQLNANFIDAEKLPANSELNPGRRDKYKLSFTPHKLLLNGSAAIDPALVPGVDCSIHAKVDTDTWVRLQPLLRDKKGQPFTLHLSPEAYAIGNASGVWYQLYNVDPIAK